MSDQIVNTVDGESLSELNANLRPDDPVTASARRKAGLTRETYRQKVKRTVGEMFDVIKH